VFSYKIGAKFTLALAKPNQPTVFHHILTEVMNSVAQKRFYFDMAEGVKNIVKQDADLVLSLCFIKLKF